MTKISAGLLTAVIIVVIANVVASCGQPPRQTETADQKMAARLKHYMIYFKDDRGICYAYTAPYGLDSSVMAAVPCEKAGL